MVSLSHKGNQFLSLFQREEFCKVFEKLLQSCNGDRRESLDEYRPSLCPTILAGAANWTCEDVACGKTNMSSEFINSILDEVATYTKENMAIVNVFIRDPYVKKYLTEEKITEISFVGNFGGLLGLFIRFSFISGFEVIYFVLVVGLGGKIRRKTRHFNRPFVISPLTDEIMKQGSKLKHGNVVNQRGW